MFENYDEILTIEELAEALRIGTSQAYKLVRTGAIKAFKEGKDWKISRQAVINYVIQRSHL
jgi:excisionase family DNA binding protein